MLHYSETSKMVTDFSSALFHSHFHLVESNVKSVDAVPTLSTQHMTNLNDENKGNECGALSWTVLKSMTIYSLLQDMLYYLPIIHTSKLF